MKWSNLPEDLSPLPTDYAVGIQNAGTTDVKTKWSNLITMIFGNAGNANSSATFYNPYKFSAYRNAGFTDGNGAFALVTFDTSVFDTGSNYSVSTGKFTAPIAGFYQFNAGVSTVYTAPNYIQIAFFKNGTQGVTTEAYGNGTGNTNVGQSISGLIQLATNDFVQVEHYGTGGAGITGATATYFQGFLVSAT